MGWHPHDHVLDERCPVCEAETLRMFQDDAQRQAYPSLDAYCRHFGIVASLLYGDIDREMQKVRAGLAANYRRAKAVPEGVELASPWARIRYAADHPTSPDRRSGADRVVDRLPLLLRIVAELSNGTTFAAMARRWYWPESTLRDIYRSGLPELRAIAARAGAELPAVKRGRPRKTAPQALKGEGVGTANPPTPLSHSPPLSSAESAHFPPSRPQDDAA